MNVRLVVEKGSSKRRTWQLHQKDTIVGRRRDCDLRILSAEVSRRHCVLSIDDGYVNVEDLDSINGTFVNGSRVVGRQVVRPGDHLQIGPLEFTVEYELQPGHGLDVTARIRQLDSKGDRDNARRARVAAEPSTGRADSCVERGPHSSKASRSR